MEKTPTNTADGSAYPQMNPKENPEKPPEDDIKTLEGLPWQERERFLY
jgi:hypothetical protein